MSHISYADLASRLMPEARDLFREMVLAHLESGSGDRLFIRSDTMSGTALHFRGPGVSKSWRGFDGGAIQDLLSYGLLHASYTSRGTQNYRVGGESILFYQWLMGQEGTAIAQTEESVRRSLASPEFAIAHPQAAHHLAQAFELLWSDRTDDQTASEIGDHLRKALMDLTSDIVAEEGDQERPIGRLEEFIESLAVSVTEREQLVLRALVDLAGAALRLDHRLNHIRDETDQKQPLRSWDEMRRAAFATAYACYELHRVSASNAR